jgi:Methyltransferase domain
VTRRDRIIATVSEHYDRHLGPVYSWMVGDVEAASRHNREELQKMGLRPGSTGIAVDLGAGPGLHAVPLTELGFSVLAIDICAALVEELRSRAGTLPIRAVEGDLLQFRSQLHGPADVILCMGDTLTHLPSREAVETLLQEVAAALASPGLFIATFRDYASAVLEGAGRFILVRGDSARSLTCFLEYAEETVTVYDLLHERTESGTQFRVSSYPKLRLDPAWTVNTLNAQGLSTEQDMTANGMIRVIARRA